MTGAAHPIGSETRDGNQALRRAFERSNRRFQQLFEAANVSLWQEDYSLLRKRLDELFAVGITDIRQYCEENPKFVSEAQNLVRVLDVNRFTLQLFHVESKQQFLKQWARMFVHESDEVFVEMLVALMAGQTSFESEKVGSTFGDEPLHVRVRVQLPSREDSDSIGIVSILDLTEHKLCRLFLKRALTAQEEERRRIARELHDEAGQSLTSIAVGLQQLQQADEIATAHALAARLQEVAEATIDEVGRLARGLHPYLLDNLGLVDALERHLDEVSDIHGLKIHFQATGAPGRDLSPVLATAVFRTVQEALTNVVRHARAARANVVLCRSNLGLCIVIEDDGRGFDPRALKRSESADGRHLGLQGIRERVELLGGTLMVDSAPGSGTTLVIKIPT